MANYYELLGITSNATLDMITQHFREKTQGLLTTRDMSDPQAVNEYQLLTNAYRTLTNPDRRQQYDASLSAAAPSPPAAPLSAPASPHVDLSKLWKSVSDTFFERSERYTPAIDAVRACIPLTVTDDHQLIIALPPEHSNLMAYLTPTVTYNQVKRILAELSGRPLEYRVIIGNSIKDWEFVQEGEELARQKRATQSQSGGEAGPVHPAHLSTIGTQHDESAWDSLLEYIVHQWSEVENRTYPQSRAIFIVEHLPVVVDMDVKTHEAGVPDEIIQRHLARIFAKIGNLSGVDAAVIVLEYLRYRERVVGGTP
ncbi:MAG: J domain-containing protein [Armatimonadota bacterium]